MILRTFKKVLKAPYIKFIAYKLLRKQKNKYEKKIICGNKYKVIKNTFGSKNDYDDAWLLYLSQNAEIVYDVGCNIGKSSLLISHSKTVNKIILVEPNPYSLSIAAENLIINDKSSIAIFISKAAYKVSGDKLKLWTMHGPFANASTDINFTDSGAISKNYLNVNTITLDDIAKEINLYPDLVKIDVEGAEHFVLEGSKDIIKNKKCRFIVEVHSSKTLTIVENTERILGWTKQFDYRAYYLSEHREIDSSNSIKHRGRYHLLLLHKDDNYPKGLDQIRQGENVENVS